MIELYDIVEAIGKILNKSLALHKCVKVHPKFKIYKIYEYNLYLLTPDKKELILSHKYILNTTADDMLETWTKCDKEYLQILFNWFKNDKLNI